MDRKVVIMDHPLIQHKLSILRDVDTSTMEFRELVNEIAMLMMYDATRDLPLEDKQVTTPCGVADCKVLAGCAHSPCRSGYGRRCFAPGARRSCGSHRSVS